MAADTANNVLVMNRIAEAHAATGSAFPGEATAWNRRVNTNYALNLGDFTNVNSRAEGRGSRRETANWQRG